MPESSLTFTIFFSLLVIIFLPYKLSSKIPLVSIPSIYPIVFETLLLNLEIAFFIFCLVEYSTSDPVTVNP